MLKRILGAVSFAALAGSALAQYPNKPVTKAGVYAD